MPLPSLSIPFSSSLAELSFYQQVYYLLLQVPKGKVTTYADLAHALNNKAYRAVGSAMANNDLPLLIPCHRVVKANGEIGCYALGQDKKARLLQLEGIELENGKVRYFHQQRFHFVITPPLTEIQRRPSKDVTPPAP
ncbi:MAG: MGMT family protein [Thiotrichales bacterium]|nr:MGMT family protein [Thiotrichales bacterium]